MTRGENTAAFLRSSLTALTSRKRSSIADSCSMGTIRRAEARMVPQHHIPYLPQPPRQQFSSMLAAQQVRQGLAQMAERKS